MAKKSKLSQLERDYIDANWTQKTDQEMAQILKRDKKTIFQYRKQMGYSKHKDASFTPSIPIIMDDGSVSKAAKEMSSRMDDEERKDFFSRQLKNTKFYGLLAKVFTPDELDYYCEEYGALCVQFSDILSTERRQLDELIKTQILINRNLAYIKRIDDEVEEFAKKIEEFRASHDMESDEEAQQLDEMNIYKISQMTKASQQISNDYVKLLSMKKSLLEDLNARRKDRLEQLTNSKTTFMGMVNALRETKVKNIQGNRIELIRQAKHHKKKAWNKPNTYCDGSRDIILYDLDADIDSLNENRKELINKVEGLIDASPKQQSGDSGNDTK